MKIESVEEAKAWLDTIRRLKSDINDLENELEYKRSILSDFLNVEEDFGLEVPESSE